MFKYRDKWVSEQFQCHYRDKQQLLTIYTSILEYMFYASGVVTEKALTPINRHVGNQQRQNFEKLCKTLNVY